LPAPKPGWFDEMEMICDDNGETMLSGLVANQAALHGWLAKTSSLG